MSFLPRFVSHDYPRIVSSDFAPVWRLIDDYANQAVSARNSVRSRGRRQPQTYNPRFDVKEAEGAYELKGELPGVEQKDIEIEFPDQQTIVIKGSTGYSREEAQAPTAQEQTQASPEAETEATPSEHSHSATVEDEPEIIDAAEASSTTETAQATPEATPEAAPQAQVAKPATPVAPTSRYWVTERSTGSFQRTFAFPVPVDTDNVTARLRNGLLEINVPKVQKAGTKRITVE